MVDWGLAVETGATGFGLVFAVLLILAVVVWIVGLLVKKLAPAKPERRDGKKG